MTRQSSSNASSFCQNIISSFPPGLRVFASYFIGRNAVERKYGFDYKVLVVGPWYLGDSLPVYPISDAKELSFLECLLLREMLKPVEPSHSVVLGVRFGPRVNRGAGGRTLSPLKLPLVKDKHFMESVLEGLALASPQYRLFDDIPPDYYTYPYDSMPPYMIPEFVQAFMEPLRRKEAMNDDLIRILGWMLSWTIRDVGLGKLLPIPELGPRWRRRKPAVTEQDASRIRLMLNVVYPRYNTRQTKQTKSLSLITAHWATIPARLFVYGPILDLVSAFEKKKIVKVCRNCGNLYRPYPHRKKVPLQRCCSHICSRRAEGKRRHRRKRRTRRKQ